MTDASTGAAPPKKRSLFKRAAWQDAAKEENEDIFSHSNEFKEIVAEENRRKEEEKRKQAEAKRKAEDEQRREQAEKQAKKGKRRRISTDYDEPVIVGGGSPASEGISISQSKERSRTPRSPSAPPPPKSLAARYNTLTRSASSQAAKEQPTIVDLGDSDEDDDDLGYKSKSYSETWDDESYGADIKHNVAIHSSKGIPVEDDGLEEIQDPEIAAIEARARARAAAKKAAAAQGKKAPIAQLFIDSELPNTAPLMVKVRIDTTIEKPRQAWCARQNFTPEMTRNVFFTWKETRLYDSTTIKRLGIKIDDQGNLSVENDDTIYDETNTPKIHVEAWTEETLAQCKREQAAEIETQRRAAEPTPEVEQREPTPEPEPEVKKYRLILKAKGMDDFKLQVKPDSTFEAIASAFRTARKISKSQPVTLMFDGERLSPMDIVQDSELEDMDSVDVMLK